ncbi:MAG: hypothetical protein MZV65_36215 [Chromatiales bacterium]|nr:hypothetical protein [Chromatiales bacterium]
MSRLTAEERTELEGLIGAGKRAASVILHARILLKADAATLTREVIAWEQGRNADPRPVNWCFTTTPDARIKLKRLPSSVNSERVKHQARL